MSDFTPKGSAIVTGCAAQGIGRAIARRLAKDGYNVAVNDLPSQKAVLETLAKEIEAEFPGRRAIATPADVSDEQGVKWMVDETVSVFGGLDVMVANAAAFTVDPLMKCMYLFFLLKIWQFMFFAASLEAFMRIQSVNVGGAFLCYREAARVMIDAKKGGRIIGASSRAGKQGQ